MQWILGIQSIYIKHHDEQSGIIHHAGIKRQTGWLDWTAGPLKSINPDTLLYQAAMQWQIKKNNNNHPKSCQTQFSLLDHLLSKNRKKKTPIKINAALVTMHSCQHHLLLINALTCCWWSEIDRLFWTRGHRMSWLRSHIRPQKTSHHLKQQKHHKSVDSRSS